VVRSTATKIRRGSDSSSHWITSLGLVSLDTTSIWFTVFQANGRGKGICQQSLICARIP
jgi:hypothetical protein